MWRILQTGKLYLIPPYLAFVSLDRKSVRFTIPLCTIRKVERLSARAGVYALGLSLWHQMKIVRTHSFNNDMNTADNGIAPAAQIVQLTALRPTADLFCSLLRDALKSELQRGQMKVVKGFVNTCYSEIMVSLGDSKDGPPRPDEHSESAYLGGLGLKFKFPGDPKK